MQKPCMSLTYRAFSIRALRVIREPFLLPAPRGANSVQYAVQTSRKEHLATLTKPPSGTWKATIRRVGWLTIAKTFRTKRDAEDWARRTEDEMVRGVFIQRAPSEKTSVADALDRYEREIVPAKKASTQRREPDSPY